MRIGVFDSGIGGKAVALRLQDLFPTDAVLSVNDHAHVPYGTRTDEEIVSLTDAALQPLFAAHCDVIVLACNTATAVAIDTLRERYPDTPFVGIEPMIKPAARLTKSHVIAVLATPGTLRSQRYRALKKKWAQDVTVIEPDCSRWAALIEDGHADVVPVEAACQQLLERNVDSIVLGCTHYHWLKERFMIAAEDRATIFEPSDAIGERIKALIDQVRSPQQ